MQLFIGNLMSNSSNNNEIIDRFHYTQLIRKNVKFYAKYKNINDDFKNINFYHDEEPKKIK